MAGRTSDAVLLRAARGEAVEHTPVWFMRQAGRSLPEYREVREGTAMLESCFTPELVVEITVQPVRRHGVDAAIFFSDIVVPLKAIGVDLDIVPGVGPVVADPIRDAAGVATPARPDPTRTSRPSLEAVRILAGPTGPLGGTPLIGFAGAPFTLASYLVEGGPSRDHARTKALMYSDPGLWHDLCRPAGAHRAAPSCGCRSTPGPARSSCSTPGPVRCPPPTTAQFVLPHLRTPVARAVVPDVPRIHFGVGTGELLGRWPAGADVVGVDWRVPLDEAAARVGPGHAAAGQPRPGGAVAPWPVVAERVRDTVRPARVPPATVTSSTSATACCRTPTPMCCAGSSSWCTPAMPNRPEPRWRRW